MGDPANNSAAVFHDEIELVFQRFHEKVKAVCSGVLTVASGVVISFAAFMSLCTALIIELTSYMALIIAALVPGAALGLIGIVMVFIGCKQLKKSIQKT